MIHIEDDYADGTSSIYQEKLLCDYRESLRRKLKSRGWQQCSRVAHIIIANCSRDIRTYTVLDKYIASYSKHYSLFHSS